MKHLAPCGANRTREVRPLSRRRPQDAHRASPTGGRDVNPSGEVGRELRAPRSGPTWIASVPMVHRTRRIVPHFPGLLARSPTHGTCHVPYRNGEPRRALKVREFARERRGAEPYRSCGISASQPESLPRFRSERGQACPGPRRSTWENDPRTGIARRSGTRLRPCRREFRPCPRDAGRTRPRRKPRPGSRGKPRARKRGDRASGDPRG